VAAVAEGEKWNSASRRKTRAREGEDSASSNRRAAEREATRRGREGDYEERGGKKENATAERPARVSTDYFRFLFT
jgi:hypothetical protein